MTANAGLAATLVNSIIQAAMQSQTYACLHFRARVCTITPADETFAEANRFAQILIRPSAEFGPEVVGEKISRDEVGSPVRPRME
jgi:hypothetical protein